MGQHYKVVMNVHCHKSGPIYICPPGVWSVDFLVPEMCIAFSFASVNLHCRVPQASSSISDNNCRHVRDRGEATVSIKIGRNGLLMSAQRRVAMACFITQSMMDIM